MILKKYENNHCRKTITLLECGSFSTMVIWYLMKFVSGADAEHAPLL